MNIRGGNMQQKIYDWKQHEVDSMILISKGELKGYDDLSLYVNHVTKNKAWGEKSGEMVFLTANIAGEAKNVALVRYEKEVDDALIGGIASAYRLLRKNKAQNIGVDFSKLAADYSKKCSRLMGEMFLMTDYDFDDYKSDKKESSVQNIMIKGFDVDTEAYEEGIVLGEANVMARKLVNKPSNIMIPEALAKFAKEEGEKVGIEVEIKDKDEIEKLGMHSYLAVASAASTAPKLIIMRWKGNPSSDQTLGYVGKGLTYDSGGLSIKPTNGMLTMKADMGGSAAVISAIIGVAKLGLKHNVTAVVASCENMISGDSFRPGDIIQSMGGKSIFIGNTDAEGRLTLIDAVTYALREEHVTHILDIATLTGAAVRALGPSVAGVISNDDAFYTMVEKSYQKTSEKMWRMPIFDDYKNELKHPEADLTNAAGSPGMMTAGLFIGEFVGKTPWVHVDIAGPAYRTEIKDPLYSRGATGSSARPLILLAKKFAK